VRMVRMMRMMRMVRMMAVKNRAIEATCWRHVHFPSKVATIVKHPAMRRITLRWRLFKRLSGWRRRG